MGNANTHVSERRKSSRGHHGDHHHGGGGSHGGGLASISSSSVGDAFAAIRQRRLSSGGANDEVGPVEVTAANNAAASAAGVHGHQQQKARSLIAAGSPGAAGAAPSTAKPHRPRAATTDAGRHRRTRQISLDQSALNEHFLLDPESGSSGGSSGVDINKSGLRSKKALPTIFKYPATAKEVYVCGTFSNWEKIRMQPSTKDFSTLVNLEEGDYQYKFLVDGQWTNDPNAADVVTTAEGHKNNVLRVRKEDFNAFDALAMDSQAVLTAKAGAHAQNGSAPYKEQKRFGQEVPPAAAMTPGYGGGNYRSGPPILPPHLLQVILNKDTPLSCEPTLLPEPNHVMLNHLYALSIKDGVMVLSSSHRYRKKYVTTLLYKPMGARRTDA